MLRQGTLEIIDKRWKKIPEFPNYLVRDDGMVVTTYKRSRAVNQVLKNLGG